MNDNNPLKGVSFDSFDDFVQLRLLQGLKAYLAFIASLMAFDMKVILSGLDHFFNVYEFFGIPDFPPESIQMIRFLISFFGMLQDISKANMPPRLPLSYLEWMMDARDVSPKVWGAYSFDQALSPTCDGVRSQWDRVAELKRPYTGAGAM